ncbi:MAG TPA: glycosyltransferase [Gemmatimonadales bacterium]|nr:glycosyltransferase [Gemmatimonadales bacterium]
MSTNGAIVFLATGMAWLAVVLQPLFLFYLFAYNTWNLTLIVLSWRAVRRFVGAHFTADLDLIDDTLATKPLTMIVPAYNEEVTIVDSINNLLQSDYPRLEVVVVNDGSKDRTLEVLQQAFHLRRTDLPYRPALQTAHVRAMYEATVPLPKQVVRLVVLDKENGGKADALNAGTNASTCPYVVSLDADSILDQRALKEMMRALQEDPLLMALGGQVAIANGCVVKNGRVVSVGLPRNDPARFQMIEYLRSFTTGRTGLDRMGCVLILSGVFAVFDKDLLIRAGGYLTRFSDSRLVAEYVGLETDTVCEDMEVVVRLHRYCRDKGIKRRVGFLPHPVAWTEVPENLDSLRKQRGRWHRGLRESLHYHGAMLFRPRYGRIGAIALPAFWLFEYLGPMYELLGYLFVIFGLLLGALSGRHVISGEYFLAFFLVSCAYAVFVNLLAILVGSWRFRYGLADRLQRSLLPYSRPRDVGLMLGYAVLEPFLWRPLSLWWRLRGQFDAWRGKSGWEKFARIGFQTGEHAGA